MELKSLQGLRNSLKRTSTHSTKSPKFPLRSTVIVLIPTLQKKNIPQKLKPSGIGYWKEKDPPRVKARSSFSNKVTFLLMGECRMFIHWSILDHCYLYSLME
ncbi:hypothetical protein AYI69_g10896 [Smittium culicis]|uniref:Uncharacterized protein n=1 Tax=Smittium culicis TaxID=133412 RepID=A0A1R1X2Q2_9FUNG|nr:hypothetical protein AYI69_g10896 [Smittium culicis]